MGSNDHDIPGTSRRRALKGLGAGLVAGAAGASVSRALAQSADAIVRGAPSGAWATGGTAAMQAAARYPDPFARPDSVCSLTCQQILGPCWAPRAPVRQDISEGEPGIPMRMALRLVESDGCTPMAGTEIEVWHTNMAGAYSADDVEGGDFCRMGNPDAQNGYFFRGRAVADAAGKVVFDGCFPGWYGGRALHVHLLARPPANAGEATTDNVSTVTQLYFPDNLSEEIFSSVPGYRDLGQPDVMNATDNVLGRLDDPAPYIFGIEQMADGDWRLRIGDIVSLDDAAAVASEQAAPAQSAGPAVQAGASGDCGNANDPVDYGSGSYWDAGAVTARTTMDGFAASAMGVLPVGKFRLFAEAAPDLVVTVCPECQLILTNEYQRRFGQPACRVVHVAELVAEHAGELDLGRQAPGSRHRLPGGQESGFHRQSFQQPASRGQGGDAGLQGRRLSGGEIPAGERRTGAGTGRGSTEVDPLPDAARCRVRSRSRRPGPGRRDRRPHPRRRTLL